MLKLIHNPFTASHETSNHFSEVKSVLEILSKMEIFAFIGKSDAEKVIWIKRKDIMKANEGKIMVLTQ